MVRRNSLLGRALESQRRHGQKLPGYGAVLGKIAADERSSKEFDKVVAIAKPASADELAAGLLDLVVQTTLEAGMAAPRVDPSGNRVGESVVVEQRAAIQASYDELFNALDVLSRAFGRPAVRTLQPPGETSRRQARPPGEPGFVAHDSPELRMHVDAWRVALGLAEATSNDPRAAALRDHVRFQTEGAPAALLAMREHLTTRREAALASLGGFPSGRKKHEGADRRAFTIMLVDGMRDLVGSPSLDFVTTMTEVLFGGGDNVYTLEGTRSLVSGQAARDAARRG